MLVLAGCDSAVPNAASPTSAHGAVSTPSASAAPSALAQFSTALASGATSRPPLASPAASPSSSTCQPTDQDQYVYSPDRLTVKAACVRVSGHIDAIREEADGDLHILLRLDAPYRRLLTSANQGEELGDLVVEPICVHQVTQADAIASCRANPDPLQNLPHTGMDVWMEGRYVLDTDHGGWAELHPLYRWGLSVTGGKPAPQPTSGAVATPHPSAGGGALHVQFTDVPNPAAVGQAATIGARTSAGASCSIQVTLPSGRVSTVAALRVDQTADGAGNVSWTWKITSNTTPGTANAAVSCSLGLRSGMATAAFTMQ
jgi:hypothetical protein